MKYERITLEYQFDCSRCKDRQCTKDGFCYDETFCKTYNRLAELEDKIENGTLIELPCKVGDKIYWITSNNEIVCAIVEYIRITKYGIVYNVKEGGCEYSMFNVDFLTKEQVEQKLKEQENEQ